MEQITSAGNRWVKLAGRLKIKKYRDKNRQFLMEGLRSAEDALAQGYRDAVCFLTEEARKNKRVEALIENAAKYHWLFLEVTEPLMQLIAGTEHGQGIMLILQKSRKMYRICFSRCMDIMFCWMVCRTPVIWELFFVRLQRPGAREFS